MHLDQKTCNNVVTNDFFNVRNKFKNSMYSHTDLYESITKKIIYKIVFSAFCLLLIVFNR